MILITAIDERGGLTFQHRRQSQDRILRERILALCGEQPLWVNAYTAKQFPPEQASQLRIAEDFFQQAGEGECCFLEDIPAAPYCDRIEQVILFRWNRRYPADFYFDITLTAPGWTLCQTEDFPGYSHEKITMEVYRHETL